MRNYYFQPLARKPSWSGIALTLAGLAIGWLIIYLVRDCANGHTLYEEVRVVSHEYVAPWTSIEWSISRRTHRRRARTIRHAAIYTIYLRRVGGAIYPYPATNLEYFRYGDGQRCSLRMYCGASGNEYTHELMPYQPH